MDDITIIHFERTGGVAGLSLSHTLITGSMKPEDADKLYQLLHTSGILQGIKTFTVKRHTADMFVYRIIIETISDRSEFIFNDDDVPEEARPLIRHLTRIARSGRDWRL
jgi:hypothetical protein